MANPSLQIPPGAKASDVASFKIKVDSAPMPDQFAVVSFMVRKLINKIPMAQLVLNDGDVAKQEFEASASPFFTPGKKVVIEMGYNQVDKKVFNGIIVAQRIKQLGTTSMQLILEIRDEAVKMTIGRKNAYFSQSTDTAAIQKIIGTYPGLKADVGASKSPTVHDELVQYFCTDWDFVVARAEAAGLLVFVDDGTVSVKEPLLTGAPVITLSFGDNVYDFEAEMDARDEFSEIKARAWDDVKREVIEKSPTAIPVQQEGNISADELADVIGLKEYLLQSSGNLKDTELTAWANSKLLRSRMSKIRGRAKITGYNVLKVGDIINIINYSPRIDGFALVSGVMHQMSGSGTWFTEVQFGFSQEWFTERYDNVMEKPASGLLPGINGLMLGTVLKVDPAEDPEGDQRVLVKLPLVDKEGKGVWARMCMLDAGKERGTYFRPEVGDEVVLGFLNDDPRQPIILGCLHSKHEDGAPPVKIDAKNYLKAIYTKAGLKLVFDDEKESITLETKDAENKIVITGKDKPEITIEDKNKNTIVMNKDGITITSGKDIILDAPQGDLKISAMNVEIAAQTELKAEGTSTAEFSSSGSTTIKGQIIQLN